MYKSQDYPYLYDVKGFSVWTSE